MDLYDICEARHGGADTSTEAFLSTPPSCRERQRKAILVALAEADRTCDEVESLLGMPHQSCSARFSELSAAGLVRVVGRRKTRTGRQARVYQIKK